MKPQIEGIMSLKNKIYDQISVNAIYHQWILRRTDHFASHVKKIRKKIIYKNDFVFYETKTKNNNNR